jgi:hypothetical protein
MSFHKYHTNFTAAEIFMQEKSISAALDGKEG